MAVVAIPGAAINDQVAALLSMWRNETAVLSSSTKMLAHPAYQELIALGPAALSAIFRDLEKSKDGHLAKALVAITGASPVPPEHRGSIEEIADDWLNFTKDYSP